MYTYTTKNLPKSEIEIEVILPFSDFEPYLKNAAVKISENVEIQGFRRGKAPYDVIKNHVGEMGIYEEAADLAVRQVYPEILEEIFQQNKTVGKEFAPVGRPEITITKLAFGNDLQFKVKLALLPQVTLPDYKKIAAKIAAAKKEVLVTDEEVEKSLNWVRESRAQDITVDRPAQKGDVVEVDFSARGGSAFGGETENNSPIITESKNHPIVIGKGNYVPGFEDQLVGLKAGEEKTFSISAPADWHDKKLAGKKLDFKVLVKLVQERKLPELTDDFVKGLGKFDTVAALRQSIREGLTREKEEKEKQRVRVQTIEDIARETKMEIPDVLIESELDKMLEELRSGIENMQMKWEDYLVHVKKTQDDLRKEWRSEAEKRVKIALALREIAREEKIEPTEEEIKEKSDEFLRRFQTEDQASRGIDPQGLRSYTIGILKNEKVFEWLENTKE